MSSSASGIASHEVGSRTQPPLFANGAEHLLAELEWLRLVLYREVLRLRAAHLSGEDQFRGLYIADEQVDAVLQDRYAQVAGHAVTDAPPRLGDLHLQIERVRANIDGQVKASLGAGILLPLLRLGGLFELSAFECKVLVVCAAPEVDLGFETLYSFAQNDVTKKRPTLDLILKLLCPYKKDQLAYRSAFSAGGRLLRHDLVRFCEEPSHHEPSFPARALKTDDRIVSFLLDRPSLDSRLSPFAWLMKPTRELSSLHLPPDLPRRLGKAARFANHEGGTFFFHGPRGAGKRSAAEALCAGSGRPLLHVDLSAAVTSSFHLPAIFALLNREAALSGADLLLAHAEALQGDDVDHRQHRLALERAGWRPGLRVFISSESLWQPVGPGPTRPWLSFDFPVPSCGERIVLWQEALADKRLCFDRHPGRGDGVASLANKFVLTGGEIHSACLEAGARARLRGPDEAPIALEDLEAAARSQSNHGLRRFAQKITALAEWPQLVLPPDALQRLHDVCAAEKYRHVVYSQWGFDQRLVMGKGLNVLFCGASGTGKTLAAGILARELALDLYKIDLSIVISKYIGETEKQLSQVFREARSSNAILFFDEADALFGKRSEVKDAHDRYANVEVAYLLQKMEEYEGIVILATNLRKNMDDAFTRRMHHIVEFPFPDAPYRERIWKGVIPPQAPLSKDVDFGFLARQFELPGGNIRNVALAAAFLAAEAGCAIRMEHLTLATARELQKMGKLPSRAEFREYYELIRGKA